jgi:hypothetical protein
LDIPMPSICGHLHNRSSQGAIAAHRIRAKDRDLYQDSLIRTCEPNRAVRWT